MTKEEKKAYDAARYAANPDKFKVQKDAYRAANPEKLKARSRACGAANRERVKAFSAAWRAVNPERKKATDAAYRIARPEKARARVAVRRAIKCGASVGDPKRITEWECRWKERKRVRCYWCGNLFAPAQCHTEHIQPLARGGAHEVGNLCVSCHPCNNRKGAKSVEEWNRALAEPVLL